LKWAGKNGGLGALLPGDPGAKPLWGMGALPSEADDTFVKICYSVAVLIMM